MPVADPVEGRQHVGGETPGLGEDRLRVLGIDAPKPRHVAQGEQYLGNGGAVAHPRYSRHRTASLTPPRGRR